MVRECNQSGHNNLSDRQVDLSDNNAPLLDCSGASTAPITVKVLLLLFVESSGPRSIRLSTKVTLRLRLA